MLGEGRVRRLARRRRAAGHRRTHLGLPLEARRECRGGALGVEDHREGRAVRLAVGVPEVEVLRVLGEDALEGRPVGVGVLVAGEPAGGAVALGGVADEDVLRLATRALDDVRHGTGGVAGNGDHADRHPAEVDDVAVADRQAGLHLAGDRVEHLGVLPDAQCLRVDVRPAKLESLVDVRLARAQEVRVDLGDDDPRPAPRGLPQRVGAADVVDVAVGQQDPPHVLDPPAELLQLGRDAGRGGRHAGVDEGQVGRVDEVAVERGSVPMAPRSGGCRPWSAPRR